MVSNMKSPVFCLALTVSGCAANTVNESAQATTSTPGQRAEQPTYLGSFGSDQRAARQAGVAALTRAQLEACGTLKLSMIGDHDSLSRAADSIDAEKRQIEETEWEIEQDRFVLDATSQSAVDGFNIRVDSHRESIRNVNAQIDDHNAILRAHRENVSRFNVQCARRPYFDEDLQTLPLDVIFALRQDSSKFDLPVVRTESGKIRIGR